MRRVAIIGGGVAGLSAALSLEEHEVPSVIIERERELGGLCTRLGCKAIDRCVRCDACLAMNLVTKARSSDLIDRLTGADVRSVSGQPGDFRIDYRSSGRGHAIHAGAIICSVGAEPFDARLDKRLGYGEIQDVITSLDLEHGLMETGKVLVPSTGLPPKKVAFILCVGSRDDRFNAGYCSKACCKYTFKMAQALKAIDQSCAIAFFYMDWRLYDPRENVRAWSSSEKSISLVRARPSEIVIGDDSKLEVRFAQEGDASIGSEPFDLVVLSIGMTKARGAIELAGLLGVETDKHGFMSSVNGTCATTRPGIFLAGACSGPKEILESAKQGAMAASMAARFLEANK